MDVIILMAVLYILNSIDYCQTMYAIQRFGLGVEANPIARFLLESDYGGIVKLVGFPILLMGIGALIHIDKKQKWALYVILAVFCCTVINNFIVLFRLGLL